MKQDPLDPWQYRLSGAAVAGARPVGPFWLEPGPELPVIPVTDANGAAVGVLLGFPIDLAGKSMITVAWQAPVALGTDADGFAYDVLCALGGRFLWLCAAAGMARIYPDCSAQVTCVYDPVARMAGSTALALLDDAAYDARFDKVLFDRLGVDGEGWFPAGLTAHHGLHRLLPNHYLDLHNWEVRRFWPTTALPVTSDPSATVDEIIAIVRAQIEALLGGPKKLAFALTAGLDTRTLMACAQPYLAEISFVTVTGGDRHEVDTVTARRIAKDLGLSHMELPRKTATDAQRALFIRRGGHCNGDSNSKFHPSVWPIAESHIFVGGAGGEIARPPIWRNFDTKETVLTSSILIDRLGLPRTNLVTTALEQRMADMPQGNAFQILDIVYQEDRYAAWYGAQFCSDPKLVRQAPFLTTRSVELMMQLPPEWKKSDRLSHAIIERVWPKLESYPYNSLGRWKDIAVKLRLAIMNPQLILKKLRKMRH